MQSAPQASPLSRYLLAAYGLLVVYASLHPLAGWESAGVDPLAFLVSPLPRYVFRLDVLANLLGYLPLGFLAVLALHPHRRSGSAVATATFGGLTLSLAMEALQSYLPSRTPSNLDLAANAFGALFGALLAARLAESPLLELRLKALRYRLFRSGRAIDLGLVLLVLWLFTQLDAQSLLFGVGDLRPALRALFSDASESHPAELFIGAEAMVACANTVAVGLLVALLAQSPQRIRRLIIASLAIALLLHAIAYGVLFGLDDAFNWLTPGAYLGAGAGLAVVLGAAGLPRAGQVSLCALGLMAATVLVNVAPENPYLANSLATWRQGYYEHFIAVTRLISGAWPFMALAYVVSLAGLRPAT